MQCRTAEMPGGTSFKATILQKCEERNDEQSTAVRLRILGAPCDLHAADAQYHKDCYLSFMPCRNVQMAKSKDEYPQNDLDAPITRLISVMNNEPDHIWTSVELHIRYKTTCNESPSMCRKQLMATLQNELGDRLVKFDISGCASLLCFRDHLPECMRLVKADDSDSNALNTLRDMIASECVALPRLHDYDIGQFRNSKIVAGTSPTLLRFVSSLVSKGEVSRASTTLAQCIQSHVTNSYNQTTLGLAVKLHHRFGSKELVTLLHEYGITVTYDEVLRFRTSVAIHTAIQPYTFRGLSRDGGTLASWVDNYDLNVFTPNGCRATHALVVEVTQQPTYNEDRVGSSCEIDEPVISRISKAEMGKTKLSELSPVVVHHYHGPNKPTPPAVHTNIGVPFKDVLKKMEDLSDALKADVKWLSDVITREDDDPPAEWSGYMHHLARDNGFVSKATRYIYGPLIDAPPSHPDTVLTSIMYIENFIKSHGQTYVHLSVDMQLFKVAMQIKWSDPTRWKHLIVRPGGMHTLTSFLGCVGQLMKGTGLEEILNVAYNGVSSMLNGKAWPKALRGLRMVVTGLLKEFVVSGANSRDTLHEELEMARGSKTGRLWVDCLIYPVSIAHLFIRAEREGNYVLHMYCLTRMVPYFFAAGHWNYARYITWHLIEFATQLDHEALAMFHKGQHVCRHRDGSWNGVFADQFGEQTYIRQGKAKGGLVGMTLSPDQVAGWVLSMHVCTMLSLAMDNMFDDQENNDFDVTTKKHKEEGAKRKVLDAADRKKIQEEISRHPHPLQMSNTSVLLNIVNGLVADDTKVNVHDAVAIGERMAVEFKCNLPTGFHKPIHSKVITMETLKKSTHIRNECVYDMEKLYARLLVISQKRAVSLEKLLSFELAPLPPALFDDYGCLRKSAKSPLLHKLAIWNEKNMEPDVVIIDGNEKLYQIAWPKTGTVRHLLHNFRRAAEGQCRTIVIFDRYDERSIKTLERVRRAGTALCPKLKLTVETALPARDAIMKNSHNKEELIKIICNENVSPTVQMLWEGNSEYKHEEADCNIIAVIKSLIEPDKHIQVVADDTDIFALLVFFCGKWQHAVQLSMKKSDGRVIDINATTDQLGRKSSHLLAVHALSGCDTVSYMFGKGKTSAVSRMMETGDVGLDALGEKEADLSDVITAGHRFISTLYSTGKQRDQHPRSMNLLRHAIFVSKKDTPKIKSLPPTDLATYQHILRAHLQTMLWKAADNVGPPPINVSDFGWDTSDGIPKPRTGVSQVAPPELLKVVACGCNARDACSRNACSCKAVGLSCTAFCKCSAQDCCHNPHTRCDEDDTSDSECDERDED